MNNKDQVDKLKKDIEKYILEEGWPGFFGLLATINPEKIDKEDLRKYEMNLEKGRTATLVNPTYLQGYGTHSSGFKNLQESGMYDPKDLQAVLEDYSNTATTENIIQEETIEQGTPRMDFPDTSQQIEGVAKVLTPRNNFSGARLLKPGETNN